jgi:hypothetical protein
VSSVSTAAEAIGPEVSVVIEGDDLLRARVTLVIPPDPALAGRVSGSKFIEVHFRDGKVVEMGNEFGLGRKEAR